MRQIKFRVWNGWKMEDDVVAGKYGAFFVNPEAKGDGLDPNDTASLTPANTKYHDSINVMQFTGLTDKNGKEIFEGDILKFEDDQTADVKWEQGGLIIYADFGDYDITTVGWAIECLGSCEVIGNIHENPELL